MPGRQSTRPSLWWYGLVVGLVLAAIIAGAPVSTFSVGDVTRDASVPVASDEESILSLEIADVTTGQTERLVKVTNYVERPITVTVSLTGTAQDYGTLVYNGSETGDTATFNLDATEGDVVKMSVDCDSSLTDEVVTFDIEADGNGFHGVVNRRTQIDSGNCGGSGAVAYTQSSGSDLRTITGTDDSPTALPATPNVIGPTAQFDGDTYLEVPHVTGDGTIALADASGESRTLVTTGAPGAPSLLWSGTWQGSPQSVFYANSSNNDIYRVTPGSDPVLVSGAVKAGAVAGVADIDGDGANELVYTGTSQTVKYIDDDGSVEKTGVGVGKNNGIGVGEPADFDGDGRARIPIVDGSNNLVLITADGSKTTVASGAEKTTVAAYNWDGDSQLELLYLDKSTHIVKVVDEIGSGATTSTVTDGSGDEITADTDAGLA